MTESTEKQMELALALDAARTHVGNLSQRNVARLNPEKRVKAKLEYDLAVSLLRRLERRYDGMIKEATIIRSKDTPDQ